MSAVRTQTLLARHIGDRVHIVTITGGGITGTLNSVAYADTADQNDPQPTAVHLVATEPLDAPVTIPWHAVLTFARVPSQPPRHLIQFEVNTYATTTTPDGDDSVGFEVVCRYPDGSYDRGAGDTILTALDHLIIKLGHYLAEET
jgi:hypothetical protein